MPRTTKTPRLIEKVFAISAEGLFDLIVSDSTFEHLSDAIGTARELDRVLKINGWICARTPNRRGYVAMMNRILPSALANRLVRSAQPDRKVQDIFPAHYRMNTLGALRKLFPADRDDHLSFAFDSEPRYHFNRRSIFTLLLGLHSITPAPLRNTLMAFIHKRSQSSSGKH